MLYPGFGGVDRSRAIAVGIAAGSPNPGVFITGTSYKPGQGLDFVTIRYQQSFP